MAATPHKRITFRSRLNAIRRTRQVVCDQIDTIDRAAPDREAPPSEMVASLTALVKLLESLPRLERCHRNECAQRKMIRGECFDDRKLRNEIARRIDALCAAREAPPQAAPADRSDAESGA